MKISLLKISLYCQLKMKICKKFNLKYLNNDIDDT